MVSSINYLLGCDNFIIDTNEDNSNCPYTNWVLYFPKESWVLIKYFYLLNIPNFRAFKKHLLGYKEGSVCDKLIQTFTKYIKDCQSLFDLVKLGKIFKGSFKNYIWFFQNTINENSHFIVDYNQICSNASKSTSMCTNQ